MNGSSAGNPFVGPRPLERGQPIFGRDEEIDQLYYLLSAERIVLFHSPSGAGKSSLLQAGLAPRLAQQFDVWIPARVSLPADPLAPDEINRYVRSCNVSLEAEVPANLRRAEEAIAGLSLAEYAAGRPRRRSAPGHIVLIFDQFEEILTVDPSAFDAQRAFFTQLAALLQNPQIWAVFALREDYLAQLDPYAAELPTHLKNRFRLDLLRREAAAEAIRRSVEGAGRSFAPDALRQLVADLATMQVQLPSGEFRSEAGPYVEPLHLQVTCSELWARLPAARATIEKEDVTSFGDVTVALASYYASAVGKVAGADDRVARNIRQWFGEELIARGSIRVQRLREPGKSAGLDNELIERLIDAHLVRAETRASATWYELAHDRLIEPVLRDNQRWFAAHLSTVEQRALQWEREGEPESLLATGAELKAALRWAARPARELTTVEARFLAASRRKRTRLLQARAAVVALTVMLAVASLLALIAWRARNLADLNLNLARKAVDESLSSAGRQQAQEFPDSPDLEAFRHELLAKAAAFYTSFTQEATNNAGLSADAAMGHVRLGDANRLLGKSTQAIDEYNRAIAAFLSLAKQDAKDTRYPEELGYCHNWMGETYRAEIDPSAPDPTLARQAVQEYNAALEFQKKLHAGNPSKPQFTQELARSYYNRGIVEDNEKDFRDAESDDRVSLGLLQPIGSHPAAGGATQTAPDPAEDLARVENNLANLLKAEKNYKDARTYYEQAIQLGTELYQASPNNLGYRYELATYCENDAELLFEMKDLDAASERNHTSLDNVEDMANPALSLSLEEVTILQLHTKILLAQGSREALDEAERERALLLQLKSGGLVQSHPIFHDVYWNLAVNYNDLAERDLKDGDLDGAQISLTSLSRILGELTPEDKAVAQAHYLDLQRKLRVKLKHR